QGLRPGRDLRAPSPPLRVQQQVSRALRSGRPRVLGILGRRARRDDRAAGPSVVPRLAVPSRVHIDPARRASALHELRHRGASVPGSALAARRRSARMNLAGFETGQNAPLFVIAGPCVIESESLVLHTAERLAAIAGKLGMPLVFKSSFDKANRTSIDSFRGPGLAEGLRILERVKREIGVPVLTDVHEDTPLDEVAEVVDVLQTPA